MLLLPGYEYLVTPAAFAGAMGAAVCIYILAWKNGIRPIRMILAGVAVSAFLGAGISALMTLKDGKAGMTVRIDRIGDSALKERLMTMGLIPGTKVKVLRSAPLGDPMMEGYNFSLISGVLIYA